MDIKQSVTTKFKKFEIYSEVDEYISDFIKNLNKSNHISTKHSCEGHGLGETAYFMFAVDENGWDIFFNKVLPEISFSLPLIKTYPNSDTELYIVPEWFFHVQDDEYNSAITISCRLVDLGSVDMVYFSWEEKKTLFWKVVTDTFLKYY